MVAELDYEVPEKARSWMNLERTFPFFQRQQMTFKPLVGMCSEPSAILILDVQAEGLKTGTPSSSSIPITIASPWTAVMHKSTSRHAQGHHLHAAAHCPQHFSATITPSTPPAPPFDHIAETLTVPYILGLAFW